MGMYPIDYYPWYATARYMYLLICWLCLHAVFFSFDGMEDAKKLLCFLFLVISQRRVLCTNLVEYDALTLLCISWNNDKHG